MQLTETIYSDSIKNTLSRFKNHVIKLEKESKNQLKISILNDYKEAYANLQIYTRLSINDSLVIYNYECTSTNTINGRMVNCHDDEICSLNCNIDDFILTDSDLILKGIIDNNAAVYSKVVITVSNFNKIEVFE